jgi:SAM-dependent methyltransferase
MGRRPTGRLLHFWSKKSMPLGKTPQQCPADEADRVRSFYEEHPYPPPIDDLETYRKSWNNPLRRRAEFHLLWPGKPFREDFSILIAGCGTSQAAKYAMRWPAARVTGLDISSTSIEHTNKLKQKYDLSNLETQQFSIEEAGSLGRHFDLIVSTGVLHHLSDPSVGISALHHCLAPGGAMHVMVYAPYGRAGIYMLQDYCRRLKIGTSSREIRDLAASLRALPPDHPLVPLLRNSPDFRSEAALADALLHPQDRAYTVEQFIDFLEAAGLLFNRWIRQAPYLPFCGGITQVPHATLLGRLPEREQFAAMELFRGNMLRHSAIAVSDNDDRQASTVSFEGDAWLDYVPIRLPGTINVEEKLPPTAAAVLINQAHTQTDIYLPITAAQKDWVDLIDGQKTVRDIVGAETNIGAAKTLFQRLWWYDQVVFDASLKSD